MSAQSYLNQQEEWGHRRRLRKRAANLIKKGSDLAKMGADHVVLSVHTYNEFTSRYDSRSPCESGEKGSTVRSRSKHYERGLRQRLQKRARNLIKKGKELVEIGAVLVVVFIQTYNGLTYHYDSKIASLQETSGPTSGAITSNGPIVERGGPCSRSLQKSSRIREVATVPQRVMASQVALDCTVPSASQFLPEPPDYRQYVLTHWLPISETVCTSNGFFG